MRKNMHRAPLPYGSKVAASKTYKSSRNIRFVGHECVREACPQAWTHNRNCQGNRRVSRCQTTRERRMPRSVRPFYHEASVGKDVSRLARIPQGKYHTRRFSFVGSSCSLLDTAECLQSGGAVTAQVAHKMRGSVKKDISRGPGASGVP